MVLKRYNGTEWTTVSGRVGLVDGLESTDNTKALTANQGKVLKDELDKCITEDGGTVKGNLTIDNTCDLIINQSAIKPCAIYATNGYLTIGAESDFKGSRLVLTGSNTGNNGEFALQAKNISGTMCALVGNPNGTLLWGSNKVETQNNRVTSVTSSSTDDQYPTAKAAYALIDTIFNLFYPIGSYAFGQHPALGTWTEVTGDRAIWLKSSVADGTTISQALPNIKGTFGRWLNNVVWSGYTSGAFGGPLQLTSMEQKPDASVGSNSYTYGFYFNANSSNSVYKDGANVQPNAYVMKVYKRTA